jgi:hypothetical protein
MTDPRPRRSLIPNANNPELLKKLLRLVASGIRRPKALAEVLSVELRTVHYYTQAAEWLGLLTDDRELLLTHEGLELARAEPRTRRRLYAAAVWRNPFAAELLKDRGMPPDTATIAAAIRAAEPELAEATAYRRASAVRGLIKPALGHAPAAAPAQAVQLSLPLGAPRRGRRADGPVDLRAGAEESPDVYARLLAALLDQGELGTGHLRALLDHMGARDAAIGGYVDMALRRADAVRVDDRLVATAGAAVRAPLAEDPVLLAISDPHYRAWLEALRAADPEDRRAPPGGRFARWDQRIFGERLSPATVRAAVDRVLMGRRLDSLGLAGDALLVPAETDGPFVDQLGVEGLALAFPTTLLELAGGVNPLNERLRRLREAPAKVRPPTLLDARARVHGGLLSPGEAPPRAIPDTHSLRLRLLTRTPAFALLGATLLLGRNADLRLSVRLADGAPRLGLRREDRGSLTSAWADFAAEQGWVCLQPADGAGIGRSIADLACQLGIATRVGEELLLDEALFAGLHEEAELVQAREALDPLADRLADWLEGLEAER